MQTATSEPDDNRDDNHDQHRDRDQRRARGVFYTPPPVAQYLVRRALDEVSADCAAGGQPPLRLLDPACGDGVFLRSALEELVHRSTPATNPRARDTLLARIAGSQLFGVDRDQEAVAAARDRLAFSVGQLSGNSTTLDLTSVRAALAQNIRHGDALLDPHLWTTSYDIVLANPPFVNIRRLTRTLGPETKRLFRDRFECASRGYDLYVLFVELAFHLLRDGGVCGMVVPNKIGSADYAATCRKLLLERTEILEITDASDIGLFRDASVYPYLMLWRKQQATRGHRVRVCSPRGVNELKAEMQCSTVRQTRWQSDTGFDLLGSLDVEQRAPTEPLGQSAHLESGTTGFQASRIARHLLESREARSRGLRPEEWFEFIVSGSIDRYRIGSGPVRFMKRRFERPVLPRDAAPLSAGKRRLFTGGKIVVAGMTRRLEAARDPGGLALGVQVYAVVPLDLPPLYLLALLNSKLLSYLFRLRFPAKRLGGGYLAINKGQLSRLPIRRIRPGHADDRRLLDRLLQRAEDLQSSCQGHCRPGPEPQDLAPPSLETVLQRAERAVDEIVYALYGLNDEEIRRVEACFPPP